MPIDGPPQMFIPTFISRTPDSPGVYALNDGFKTIYYGSTADSIKARLMDHFNGSEGPCTQDAIWFHYETTSSPRQREAVLLAEFLNEHGKPPTCNDKSPPPPE